MTKRTFLITGGNRGLGREVCRQLALEGHRVLLAARDADAARTAAAELGVTAVTMDVASATSVDAAAAYVREQLGSVDVVVNNAAVYDGDRAHIVETNVRGPLRVLDAFLPLLPAAPTSAVVMVSSGMGALGSQSRDLATALERAHTRDDVDAVTDAFARGDLGGGGAYGASKALLNGYTRALARELAPVRVNAVCPGWVRTDMGGRSAPRSVEEGGRSIVATALLDEDQESGGFFRDGRSIDW